MKIGLVGYQGSGKSTLFEWLTGAAPDQARAHLGSSAMVPIPDDYHEPLREIFKSKKVTQASLEVIDTPGLSRTPQGNAAKLALIREAGCLCVVVGAFDQADPAADFQRFDDDLLLADLEIVTGRVERLREAVKKPRPSREKDMADLAALEPLLASLEAGQSLVRDQMTENQVKATRTFGLFAEKPRLIIVNLADDETMGGKEPPEAFLEQIGASARAVAVPLRMELELAQMASEEQAEFKQEMGLKGFDRDPLIKLILDASGQMLFFTGNQKEVRTWMLRKGSTALDAARVIHSDLARGFIRAEIFQCEDLIRLGSLREVKAKNLVRQESKDYVIQDGEYLGILSGV